MSIQREQVFKAIDSERYYQDRKWGTIGQRPKDVGAWLLLMQVHLNRAFEAWAESKGDTQALEGIRKVLAVGTACAEQHGIPSRSLTQPVSERMYP